MAQRSDGTLTKDYWEIVNMQFELYETHNPKTQFTATNSTSCQLEPQERLEMEEDISEDELFDAVMTLKPGHTPGCDGLTLEFYRKFWKDLLGPLSQAYRQATVEHRLNPSARRGIINLILKKCRDELWIKNWRPITLLNYDYKIWAKAIANRLLVSQIN